VTAVVLQTPGSGASPGEIVQALRSRALSFAVFADALADSDKGAAAVAREEAVQLRCQAAVIEAMAALYDELGLQAQRWGEFAARLRRSS
jgi:hypothetical protein